MATTIKTKNSTTAATAPTGLVQGELAVNITDKKLYVGDSVGNSIQIAGAGATNAAGGSTTQVQYNSSGALAGSANMTFDGTTLTVNGLATTGTVTVGDASGDALTINSSAVSIPNGLNFDSNTLVIDATNNRVGVNNASPANALDVTGTYISINRAGAVAGYSIKDTSANKSAFFQYTNGTSLFVGAEGTTPIVFANTDSLTERMRIDSSGNVGIGTSSPSGRLSVTTSTMTNQIIADSMSDSTTYGLVSLNASRTSTSYLGIAGGGGTDKTLFYNVPSTGKHSFRNNFSEQMVLDSSGNLGLGVTPNTWYLNTSVYKALQFGSSSLFFGNTTASSSNLDLIANAYLDTSAVWRYLYSSNASKYGQSSGAHAWYTAPSGTAGNTITFTQAMTLDASGNLGIGTSSPSTKLQVAGVGGFTGVAGTTTIGCDSTGGYIEATTSIPLRMYTGGSERMRITSSGNVGIGTSSPRVVGTGYKGLEIYNTSGSSIWLSGNSDTYNAYMSVDSGGLNLTAVTSMPLLFGTNNTERMRIDSSGNVLVGTTTAYGHLSVYGITGSDGTCISLREWGSGAGSAMSLTARSTANADVIYFNTSSTNVGKIAITSTATSYVTSSDYRLKENVAPMTGALAKNALLKPVTYTWKADGSAGEGFIAHELAEVMPQAVTGEKDAVNEDGSIKPQGIDTSFLVGHLVACIQELKAEVDSLKAQLGAK